VQKTLNYYQVIPYCKNTCVVVLYIEEGVSGVDNTGLVQTLGNAWVDRVVMVHDLHELKMI